MKTITILALTAFISGCASDTKTVYSYAQSFDSGYSYQKAISQCQYEEHLQARADARADIDSGRSWSEIFKGKPSKTQIYCMSRFGWELQEKVIPKNEPSQIAPSMNGFVNANPSLPRMAEESKQQISKKKFDALVSQEKALCVNPKYKAYFDRSPCSVVAMTEHDTNVAEKISYDELLVTRDLLIEKRKIHAEQIEILKSLGDDQTKLRGYIFDTYFSMAIKNWEDLLEKKISWGDYNKERGALDKKMTDELNTIR